MRTINIHLISDATGETIHILAKAIFSQFDEINTKEYYWSLNKTKAQLEKTLKEVGKRKGIVVYTIADEKLKEDIESYCKEKDIFCLEALGHLTSKIANYLGVVPNPRIGGQHTIDQEYFNRIEAMNYTISHDDGQVSDNFHNADIILLGPSRTSKSPTSMYLAFKGFKTANIPLVSCVPLDESIFLNKKIFFVGLTISPRRLVEIRKSRLLSINEENDTEYTDFVSVKEEVIAAKNLCLRNNIPIIDITRRSVEETSALIIQKYFESKKQIKLEVCDE